MKQVKDTEKSVEVSSGMAKAGGEALASCLYGKQIGVCFEDLAVDVFIAMSKARVVQSS
jgi:hypothetical protein